MSMTDSSTNRLVELIDKRQRCLVALHELSTRQSGMIADGDMSALLRSFSVKNQWLVALQAVERDLAPFHQQNPEERVWASEAVRQQCAEKAATCNQLLRELMKLEKQNEQEMTQRRDRVAAQLQNVQSADAARNAYQTQQQVRRDTHHTPVPNLTEETHPSRLDLHSEAN